VLKNGVIYSVNLIKYKYIFLNKIPKIDPEDIEVPVVAELPIIIFYFAKRYMSM
jgi:hypothetical protein